MISNQCPAAGKVFFYKHMPTLVTGRRNGAPTNAERPLQTAKEVRPQWRPLKIKSICQPRPYTLWCTIQTKADFFSATERPIRKKKRPENGTKIRPSLTTFKRHSARKAGLFFFNFPPIFHREGTSNVDLEQLFTLSCTP